MNTSSPTSWLSLEGRALPASGGTAGGLGTRLLPLSSFCVHPPSRFPPGAALDPRKGGLRAGHRGKRGKRSRKILLGRARLCPAGTKPVLVVVRVRVFSKEPAVSHMAFASDQHARDLPASPLATRPVEATPTSSREVPGPFPGLLEQQLRHLVSPPRMWRSFGPWEPGVPTSSLNKPVPPSSAVWSAVGRHLYFPGKSAGMRALGSARPGLVVVSHGFPNTKSKRNTHRARHTLQREEGWARGTLAGHPLLKQVPKPPVLGSVSPNAVRTRGSVRMKAHVLRYLIFQKGQLLTLRFGIRQLKQGKLGQK